MARAELFVPPPIQPPTEIRLTLSQEEAQVLQLVLRNVGGDPAGYRGKSEAILNALHKVVSKELPGRFLQPKGADTTSLYFIATKE